MNIRSLKPVPKDSVGFDLYALARTPEIPACYCLTNASGEILYVGQAASLRQRVVQHFSSEKREAKTSNGRVSLVWWLHTEVLGLSRLERGWMESVRLIDGQLPPLNRVSAPS